MNILYLLAILRVAFAIAIDDGCGKYDRYDTFDICGQADINGKVYGDAKLGAYGKCDKQDHDHIVSDLSNGGKFDICDNEYRDHKYHLNADLRGKGKFHVSDNDDRVECLEQASKFRPRTGYICGKKTRYSDHDTCDHMKPYADKNWHAKVGLAGDVNARSKYGLTGKPDLKTDFYEFGSMGTCDQLNDQCNGDVGEGYEVQGKADFTGPNKVRGDMRHTCRCERHDKLDRDRICSDKNNAGKIDIRDTEYRDGNNRLNADHRGKRKFYVCGNDDRMKCYQQVSKLRPRAGYNICGKKKRYIDHDARDQMKPYADKNWHAKVGLAGDVYARGKYGLTEEADSKNELCELNGMSNCGQFSDQNNGEFGQGYMAQSRADFIEPNKAHMNTDRSCRYERRDDLEQTPYLCAKYCERYGGLEPCYKWDP